MEFTSKKWAKRKASGYTGFSPRGGDSSGHIDAKTGTKGPNDMLGGEERPRGQTREAKPRVTISP